MTDKIMLYKGELTGGLKSFKQCFRINYMLPTIEYGDKIELSLQTPGKNGNETFYHSLRFTNPEQVLSLIRELSVAYAVFLKKRGLLNEHNAIGIPHVFYGDLMKKLQRVLKSWP